MSVPNEISPQTTIENAWKEWREKDYTWTGLESKTADCYASLKDYWIKSASPKGTISDTHVLAELIEKAGQPVYHIAHLPLLYDDGTPTIKTTDPDYARQLLDAAIYARLNRHGRIDAYGRTIPEYFEGSVFLEFRGQKSATDNIINGDFENCIFTKSVDMWNCFFSEAVNFHKSIFIQNVNFSKSIFKSDPTFSLTTFLDKAWFQSITFRDYVDFNESTFLGRTTFSDAKFEEEADFYGTRFISDVSFDHCRFSKSGNFSWTVFSQGVDFASTVFEDQANFWDINFGGSVSFQKSQFLKHASFCGGIRDNTVNLTLPANPLDLQYAFDKAVFNDIADFSYWGCRGFAAFEGATFKAGLKFDYAVDSLAAKNFQVELKAFSAGDFDPWWLRLTRLPFNKSSFFLNEDREARLRSLEAGCRVLKQEMAKVTDKAREHQFYRFELLAKRQQEATSLSEKFVSCIYGLVSDYGHSIFRPQLILSFVFLSFAALYAAAFHPEATASDNIVLGLIASASRVFPLGAFGLSTSHYADDVNGILGPIGAGVFMVLATFESIVATILVFLSGLAIKRKFQII